MAHYLRTVNPEAADAIKPDVEKAGPLPTIGDVVLYYPRPGEGSGGRMMFPLMITHVQDDGRVAGIAFIDVSDFRSVTPGIWQRSELNPWPAWDWKPSYPAPDRGDMADTLQALFDRIDAQDATVTERIEDALGKAIERQTLLQDAIETLGEVAPKMTEAVKTVETLVARVHALEELLGVGSEAKPRRRK